MDMEVFFPGNKKVHARYKGFVVETDQPTSAGGDGSAIAPLDLFFASIGTCSGFYMLRFMQERGLSTDGASLVMRQERDPESKLVAKISWRSSCQPISRQIPDCSGTRGGEMRGEAPPRQPPAFETYVTLA